MLERTPQRVTSSLGSKNPGYISKIYQQNSELLIKQGNDSMLVFLSLIDSPTCSLMFFVLVFGFIIFVCFFIFWLFKNL